MAVTGAGLEGIIAAESEICFIDGDKGILAYQGYNVHELAPNSNFEETCYLLWFGRLPKKAELDDSTDKAGFAWRFWHLDWSPSPGEHTVTSRAIDQAGNIQPAPDEASIANKRTYWESNGQITRRIRIA